MHAPTLVGLLVLLSGVALARTYNLPLTAESLAHMTEDVLLSRSSHARISLRGEQAEPFYRGAAARLGVEQAYVLGLWLRPDGDAVVLAAPSGVRLSEWVLYAAASDGRALNMPTMDVVAVLDELARIARSV